MPYLGSFFSFSFFFFFFFFFFWGEGGQLVVLAITINYSMKRNTTNQNTRSSAIYFGVQHVDYFLALNDQKQNLSTVNKKALLFFPLQI